MFRLTLSFGGKTVKKFNFEHDSVCIGRDPECEILIDNIGISRRHATIERANDDYVLTDLKSHNGTFVRGQRIYHHQLNDGDEFFIGKYSLQFENLDVATEKPEPPPLDLNRKGMQDMTFQLDKSEIERIMGASTSDRAPKVALVSPEKEQATWKLDRPWYLIGSHESAPIRIRGWGVPPFLAMIVKDDKTHHLVSLSPKKAAKVNGQKVMDHALSDGDFFELGRRRFRFTRM